MKKLLVILIICCMSSSVVFGQTEKPIASYPLNSNTMDVSGNGFNATVSGNVSPTTNKDGKFGCAMQFDKQSYLSIKYNPVFKIENDSMMAISFWIKFNSLSGNDTILKRGKSGAIFNRKDDELSINPQYGYDFDKGISDTNWHFIEIIGNGWAGRCSLYVDKKISQQYIKQLPQFGSIDDLYIGNFDGKLDDLKFFAFNGDYGNNAQFHFSSFVSNTLESCKFTYNKKDDDLFLSHQLLAENNIYSFNINDYTKGRDILTTCKTTKADSNTIDLFIKFKALASTMSLVLNVDNANLESIIELTSPPYTCNKDYQVGKNQRNYTFSGLTVGTDYTARIEIGGDAALGFARMNAANNASIVLKSGVVTDIESENTEPTKTISNIYNLQGIEVTKDYSGMVIYKYTDGSTQKVVQ